MKNIWQAIGRVGYYVTLPALYLQLRWSRRTRVFIRCGDELLVVKGWLSRGDWSFPGGGLKRGEDPRIGAAREVQEEVQIEIDPDELVPLFDGRTTNPHHLTYHCIAFGIDFETKPEARLRIGELTDVKWIAIDELLKMPDSDRLLKPALEAWAKLR